MIRAAVTLITSAALSAGLAGATVSTALAPLADVADVLAPMSATPGQLEPADRTVKRVRLTYAERIGRRAYVELNNGAAYKLRPCRSEDGRNCYWDAAGRGNHKGRSFAVIGTRVLYETRRTIGSLSRS